MGSAQKRSTWLPKMAEQLLLCADMLVEKLVHQLGHLVAVGFQGEVAGVD